MRFDGRAWRLGPKRVSKIMMLELLGFILPRSCLRCFSTCNGLWVIEKTEMKDRLLETCEHGALLPLHSRRKPKPKTLFCFKGSAFVEPWLQCSLCPLTSCDVFATQSLILQLVSVIFVGHGRMPLSYAFAT